MSMANAAFLNTLGDQSKSRHSKYLPENGATTVIAYCTTRQDGHRI